MDHVTCSSYSTLNNNHPKPTLFIRENLNNVTPPKHSTRVNNALFSVGGVVDYGTDYGQKEGED